jgi:hypothetical protein
MSRAFSLSLIAFRPLRYSSTVLFALYWAIIAAATAGLAWSIEKAELVLDY